MAGLLAEDVHDAELPRTQALRLLDQGKPVEAIPLLEKRVALVEKTDGTWHTNVADALDDLAHAQEEARRLTNALASYQRSLEIWQKILGPESGPAAEAWRRIGRVYRNLDDFSNAKMALERAVAIQEKLHGADDSRTALALLHLADLQVDMAVYKQAETNYLRALRINEAAKDIGPEHPTTAGNRNALGLLYYQMERYEEAEQVLRRAVAIMEKNFGTNAIASVNAMNNLAMVCKKTERYSEAESLYQRVLSIKERSGVNGSSIAVTMGNLGLLYEQIGDYSKAEQMLTRSFELKVRTLGTNHSSTAIGATSLAVFYVHRAEWGKAETLYRLDLRITESVYGNNHPNFATSLNNLANLYLHIKDYPRAESLLLRALKIRETFGETPALATTLNNLAGLYHQWGRLRQAETNYLRALKIDETAFGRENTAVAGMLSSLGMLYAEQMNDPEKGVQYVERALRIYEKKFRPDHPELATPLNNLARVRHTLGELTQAEALLERALSILEPAFGLDHPQLGGALRQLACVKVDLGRASEAVPLLERVQRGEEKTLTNVLSFASEQERLNFLQHTEPYSYLASLGSAKPLATALLHNKGVVLDSLLEEHQLAEASADPHGRELVEKLRSAKGRLSALVARGTASASAKNGKANDGDVNKVAREIEELESQLARRCASLGAARRALTVTVQNIQDALPERTVLIDYLLYAQYSGKQQWEERYGAVVTGRTGEPRWVPLAAKTNVENRLKDYQFHMRNPADNAALSEVLHDLYEQLWKPVERVLPPDVQVVTVCPDRQLNFLSFATLLTSSNEFLGQKYSIGYVASGRDLLPKKAVAPAERNLVIFANPAFDWTPDLPAADAPAAPVLAASSNALTRDVRGLNLRPLPGTEREGRRLQTNAAHWGFSTSVLHVGADATEAELRRMDSPYVLHLGTHGFFLPVSEEARAGDDENQGLRKYKRRLLRDHPMRRSGFALAGARRTLAGWEKGEFLPPANDGIVMAEDVSTLKLQNTWLVVLAACETGSGEVSGDEGVLGLRRGFMQAGARNLLMTLWPIDDEKTASFMTDFYTRMHKLKNAPAALAEVQREWLVRLKRDRGLAEACRVAGPFILSFQGAN